MTWIRNSLVDLANNTAHNTEVSYALIAHVSIILLHSWYLHGTSWNRVRIINDCVCLCSIGTALGIAYSNVNYTQYNIAYGVDMLGYGIFSSALSVLDLAITYSRYKLLSTPLCAYQDAIVIAYILLLVVATQLPFYTFVPLFINENRGAGLVAVNTCLYYIFAPAVTFFNVLFAGIFYTKIVCWKYGGLNKVEQHPKMRLLAYKSGIHAFTSSCSSVYMASSSMINPVQGQLIYCFILATTIHCLFNWKFEKVTIFQKVQKVFESPDDKNSLYPYEVDYEQVVVKNDGVEMAIDTGLGMLNDVEKPGAVHPYADDDNEIPLQSQTESARTTSRNIVSVEVVSNAADPVGVAKRMGFI